MGEMIARAGRRVNREKRSNAPGAEVAEETGDEYKV